MQIVIGLVAAVVLFLVMKGRAAPAVAAAPPPAPPIFIQLSTPIVSADPNIIRGPVVVPGNVWTGPPPPELPAFKAEVKAASPGAVQIADVPFATRSDAVRLRL